MEASSVGPAAARVRLRWFLLACAVAAGAVLIDQGSKALALAQLSEDDRIPLLGDWLGLQLAFNPRHRDVPRSRRNLAAHRHRRGGLCRSTRRRNPRPHRRVGGRDRPGVGSAVGNLLDRLFAPPPEFGRGHVTDFLAYGNLFIGNLADVILGFGVAWASCFTSEAHTTPGTDNDGRRVSTARGCRNRWVARRL